MLQRGNAAWTLLRPALPLELQIKVPTLERGNQWSIRCFHNL